MAAAFFALAGPAFPGTVIDEIGRTVEVPTNPARLIGLSPSLTEILFGLGLGPRVVGATKWADSPPAALKLPRVGAYISPNLEQIVALAPDLVLANRQGNPPWVVEKLERAGVPVFVTDPDDPKKLPASLIRIGQVCGAAEAGRLLAAELQAKYDYVSRRLAGAEPVPTLVVIGSKPVVSAGPESYTGRLLAMAGAANVAASVPGRWPRLSREYIIQAQPKLIVVSTMERGAKAAELLRYWREMPGLKGRADLRVAAVSSNLIDRPGPRLGEGLEALARIVHPERFPARKETGR